MTKTIVRYAEEDDGVYLSMSNDVDEAKVLLDVEEAKLLALAAAKVFEREARLLQEGWQKRFLKSMKGPE